jgi:hypothetical protein
LGHIHIPKIKHRLRYRESMIGLTLITVCVPYLVTIIEG